MKTLPLDHSCHYNSWLIILLCLVSLKFSYAQDTFPADSSRVNLWVDSVLSSLSPDERIAQLIVARANNPKQEYFPVIERYILEYNIGGICFFGGFPVAQLRQTNAWQSIARTPLMISIDGEWGLGMRLDSTVSFPYQMALGAIQDTGLIREMGLEIAQECKRMGIQVNFAPVVDINSNPANPVIHMRSFGEDRERVTSAGTAYMLGLQQGGILATAKHFPGHGDTGSDSHYTLPVINHDRHRLDSIELYPFKSLISHGLAGIMVAHLHIPSLDPRPNLASTLSQRIVTGLLREELGFQGLIVTDALDMKGVTLNDKPGDIELKAFLAGNDILLLSANIPAAISRLRAAVARGEITQGEVDRRCRRVLEFKYKAGLWKKEPIPLEGLLEDLNGPRQELINRQLFESAVTLVKNDLGLVPVKDIDTLSIATVSIGYDTITPFQARLSYYAPMTHFHLGKQPSPDELSSLAGKLKSFDLLIISLQNCGLSSGRKYGLSQEAVDFVLRLMQQRDKKIILDLFASPYSLGLFVPKSMMAVAAPTAIVVSYQDHPLMQDISAQAIFGGVPIRGKLPVTASPVYPCGTGIETEPIRIGYTIPEAFGINSTDLEPVDSIVEDAIRNKVFPGCQVMAIFNGKVLFLKSYGHHTYDNIQKVNDFDLYDLASLTKITASTLSVMKLVEEGKLNLDQVLSHYLPYLGKTNKSTIVIREMMAHQARLKSWIPFYKSTVSEGKLDTSVYQQRSSGRFPTRVADNIYILRDYDEVIMDTIISSRLLKTSSYKYSDLGFFFVKELVEYISGTTLDSYAARNFWSPLGLSTMGYLPRRQFPLQRLIPTELDLEFRMQLIHGDVHDPGAAMLGGVGGHAGVFSNANDLGVIGQMLLQEGIYGGDLFLDPSTIQEFTRMQFPLNDNRRGIGFDRPAPSNENNGPACKSASSKSYGHTGFTGTYLWVDPMSDLVFIFLSNRVYPSAKNTKLSEMRIRPQIHQVFYDAIEKSHSFTR